MFKLRNHFLLIASLMLAGCGTSPLPSAPLTIPSLDSGLAQDCPKLSVPSANYDDWQNWLHGVLRLYGECASRHHQTVKAWPKTPMQSNGGR